MYKNDCVLSNLSNFCVQDFDARKATREKGIRYCEPVVLTYQAERMPEQIRLKVGGETPQQIAVYEEFARNIPGFLPLSEPSLPGGVTKPMPVRSCMLEDTSYLSKVLVTLRVEGSIGMIVGSDGKLIN